MRSDPIRSSLLAGAAVLGLAGRAAAAPAAALDWNGADLLAQFEQLRPPPDSVPTPPSRPLQLLSAGALAAQPVPLECQPDVIAAFKTIWKQAGYGMRPYEGAFRIDRSGDGYQVVFMPLTYSYHQAHIYVIPGVTVAIAHTHPNDTGYVPSWKDMEAAYPNYVVSRRYLYVTEPGNKSYHKVRDDWQSPCR